MSRAKYGDFERLLGTFIEKSEGVLDEYDYLTLVQEIRMHLDLEQWKSPCCIQSCSLTITRRLRGVPHIQSIQIKGPMQSVEVVGIYHHGVEELLYLSSSDVLRSHEPYIRSLRHYDDEIIKQGMRWLCMMLLVATGESGTP